MVVFDRLGPVVKVPVKEDGSYDAAKAEELKISTVLHKGEQFSPADLKVIATQTEAVANGEVWSDPSVGSEAEMLTPPNLTSPEDGTTTHIDVPEEDAP